MSETVTIKNLIAKCGMCKAHIPVGELESIQYKWHWYKVCHECGLKVFNLFLCSGVDSQITPKEVRQHFKDLRNWGW